jgi:hypothetical protein
LHYRITPPLGLDDQVNIAKKFRDIPQDERRCLKLDYLAP